MPPQDCRWCSSQVCPTRPMSSCCGWTSRRSSSGRSTTIGPGISGGPSLMRATDKNRMHRLNWFREASRVEPRDYVDTAAALERYSPAQLIGFARRLDPGLTDRDFADAGRRLDELSDRRFTAGGLSPQETAELRRRFAIWPRT